MTGAPLPDAVQLEQRQRFRAMGKQVRQRPQDPDLHVRRLQAALAWQDDEPLQGAIADLFHALPGHAGHSVYGLACELAQARLPRHVAQGFAAQLQQHQALPAIHWLATRWSVLVQPSAAVSALRRRVSVDESRRLAAAIVQAHMELAGSDAQTLAELEQEFFAHCQACDDRLAFMLARRQLLARGPLPDAWQAAEGQLAQDGATAAAPIAENSPQADS